jgi:hypothetical protein
MLLFDPNNTVPLQTAQRKNKTNKDEDVLYDILHHVQDLVHVQQQFGSDMSQLKVAVQKLSEQIYNTQGGVDPLPDEDPTIKLPAETAEELDALDVFLANSRSKVAMVGSSFGIYY